MSSSNPEVTIRGFLDPFELSGKFAKTLIHFAGAKGEECVQVDCWGDKVSQFNEAIGRQADITCRVTGNLWKDRWFTNLKLERVELLGAEQAGAGMQPASQTGQLPQHDNHGGIGRPFSPAQPIPDDSTPF